MNTVKMLVTVDSPNPSGLVAMKVQDVLESAGAKNVTVTLCGLEYEPMPFGKYKGTPLDKVPSAYLDHIYGEEWIKDYPFLVEYITNNLKRIHEDIE